MYQPRFYRKGMGTNRFTNFSIIWKETDLWIGIDPDSYRKEIPAFVRRKIINLRGELDAYISENPEFRTSLVPLEITSTASKNIKNMAKAATKVNIGPMAAVAGLFAQEVGKTIINKFNPKELIIENGGDLFIKVEKPIIISVYAGSSLLSCKVGLNILPVYSPLGICTSAGTFGHSFSKGKADAVVVVCKNTTLADVFATAFCNQVQTEEDISKTLMKTKVFDEILSVLIIKNNKLGVKGKLELKALSSKENSSILEEINETN